MTTTIPTQVDVDAFVRHNMLSAIAASGRTVEDVCAAAGTRVARLTGDEVLDVEDVAKFVRTLGCDLGTLWPA